MENASKALIMAGGTLLAILIMSLIVYVSTTSTRIAETQDQKKAKQQTAEFNKQYEAYDKSRMYGTDIISIVNRAIDYNKRLDIDSNDKDYKINIVLKLKNKFETTDQIIIYKANGQILVSEDPKIVNEKTLSPGTYELFERDRFNDEVLSFFAQETSDTKKEERDGINLKITYTYSAMKNFKSAIFQCANVEYSDITGRVSSMTFVEI